MKYLVIVSLFFILFISIPSKASGDPYAPYIIEPNNTDSLGNSASRNSGGYFDRPDFGYFNLVYWLGTNDEPGRLILFFDSPFGDGPQEDFAIVTGQEVWGTLADTARFEFYLDDVFKGSFEASLSANQIFTFDLPGNNVTVNRVEIINSTPDPPGINDLAAMEFIYAGIDQEALKAAVVKRDEIIGTFPDGIRYYNFVTRSWTKMNPWVTTSDIAAGDFTGDGKADVAANFPSGLWYQNGASLGWTELSKYPCHRVTAGDVTGDGREEIIGTWNSGGFSGFYYGNFVTKSWHKLWKNFTNGDIAAGDFTGDGKADVAANWSTGLWYYNTAARGWRWLSDHPANNLTAGDVNGDGRAEIIGSWSGVYNGLYYGDLAAGRWTQITRVAPSGDIAAGEFTGDNKDDVCATFSSGLACWKGDTGPGFWDYGKSPYRLTAGDVTGN